jgi:hypothetical protein
MKTRLANLDLRVMPKQEKHKFLSMDLAERMIRIEQTVSAFFHKYVPYYQTEYYKSMTDKEKEEFREHLKNKNKNKFLSFFLVLAPLFVFALLRVGFTGNVVRENIGEGVSIIFEIICLMVFAVLLILFLYSVFLQKRISENLKRHIKILDNVLAKKRRD